MSGNMLPYFMLIAASLVGGPLLKRDWKDIKQVVAGLKKIYTAVTLGEAEENLLQFREEWRRQYPSCVKSREENWEV